VIRELVIKSGRQPEGITMSSSRSKTHQIIAAIEARILSGELKPGDRIPSARELREQFDASATPVRDAVNHLKARGVVVGEPGVGVFVADQPRITRTGDNP
jgi:DNA-binding FadR family transcriptional regulator